MQLASLTNHSCNTPNVEINPNETLTHFRPPEPLTGGRNGRGRLRRAAAGWRRVGFQPAQCPKAPATGALGSCTHRQPAAPLASPPPALHCHVSHARGARQPALARRCCCSSPLSALSAMAATTLAAIERLPAAHDDLLHDVQFDYYGERREGRRHKRAHPASACAALSSSAPLPLCSSPPWLTASWCGLSVPAQASASPPRARTSESKFGRR